MQEDIFTSPLENNSTPKTVTLKGKLLGLKNNIFKNSKLLPLPKNYKLILFATALKKALKSDLWIRLIIEFVLTMQGAV